MEKHTAAGRFKQICPAAYADFRGRVFQMIRSSRGLVSNALAKRTAIGLHFIQHEGPSTLVRAHTRAFMYTKIRSVFANVCLVCFAA